MPHPHSNSPTHTRREVIDHAARTGAAVVLVLVVSMTMTRAGVTTLSLIPALLLMVVLLFASTFQVRDALRGTAALRSALLAVVVLAVLSLVTATSALLMIAGVWLGVVGVIAAVRLCWIPRRS